ncbi:selenium cofactor biosynthesis protein YqeC [Halovivax gelatinilyticus]|uniref:selenium cofactor biosynthesis protein YqeC n=1 Tax=Halovivax gelatinilyticus TaxID=2961597 RepID=UPI0020CA3995|nr:selenium cofactor biosynthesis protein YqeC [Halovivax gelatinilyticus]
MELERALEADAGLICVVGAGGKKTTLYTLANRLDRAVLTATVRIPIFDGIVESVVVGDDPLSVTASHSDAWPIGLVPGREGDRYLGFAPDIVSEIAATHDGPVLVKADGARTREFKAPSEREPQIPSTADVVLPIASVDAVGRALSAETVHRPERIAELTGLDRGQPITSETIATVLTHPAGGLKSVPAGATVIPVLNKVDDESDAAIGREIARRIDDRLDLADSKPRGVSVPRIVLASMIEPTVVDVLERS